MHAVVEREIRHPANWIARLDNLTLSNDCMLYNCIDQECMKEEECVTPVVCILLKIELFCTVWLVVYEVSNVV